MSPSRLPQPACAALSLAARPLHSLPGMLVLAVLCLAPVTLPAGSIEAGEEKSVTCAACHGPDGNSVNPDWPSIAGQNERYIIESLQAYVAGTRDDVLMTEQARALSEQDMRDLAAFYAAQTPEPRFVADPDLLSLGERIYRGGNMESRIGACSACHGPNGAGNAPAGYPAIAGQHARYTAAQLRLYRSGERRSDYEQMMRSIAERMTDREIEAVASYIQGLY